MAVEEVISVTVDEHVADHWPFASGGALMYFRKDGMMASVQVPPGRWEVTGCVIVANKQTTFKLTRWPDG